MLSSWFKHLRRPIRKPATERAPKVRRRLGIECLEDRLTPAAGELDLSFGSAGKVATAFTSTSTAAAIVADPNDGYYIAGSANGDFLVAHYLANGDRDTSFGALGAVAINFGGADQANAIALDSQGRIVVAGTSNGDFAMARLDNQGFLDASFGASMNGKVVTDIGGEDAAAALLLDANDNIVLGGYTDNDFALARYTSDGQLDGTFGSNANGIVITDFNGDADQIAGLAFDSLGNIVAAGSAGSDIAVARYTSQGVLDASFGASADGKVTVDIHGNFDHGSAVAIDGSDNILVAGFAYANDGSASEAALLRLTSAGVLDNTFGSGGTGVVTIGFGGQDDAAAAVAIDPLGRIVIAGSALMGTDYDFAIGRFNADGTPDLTFGAAGKGGQTADFGSTDDNAFGLALDSHGRALVAGFSTNPSGSTVVATARFLADPGTTTVVPAAAAAMFGTAAQTLTLNALVASTDSSPVNQGTVTFSVLDSAGFPVGVSVVSATVSNGAATAKFVLPANTPVGAYQVRAVYNPPAHNAAFIGSSGNTSLTIRNLVVTNPQTQFVPVNQTAVFTATATGALTPTVQWQVSVDGAHTFSNIAGATTATLSVKASAQVAGNYYRAVFTNSAGQAVTAPACLIVTYAVKAGTTAQTVTVPLGATIQLSASAKGSPTPTVQWEFSADAGKTYLPVPGAVSTTLLLTDNTPGSRLYRAAFTNTFGTARTAPVTITAGALPSVTLQPMSLSVNSGQNAVFTTSAANAVGGTVTWQASSDGLTFADVIAGVVTTTLNGIVTSKLTVSAATASQDHTLYRTVFVTTIGKAVANPATLVVNALPVIVLQPKAQSAAVGGLVTLSALAKGSPTPTVQWERSVDGGKSYTPIAGALTSTYTFVPGSAGSSMYRAAFANASGTVRSSAATITVSAPPVVTSSPTNTSVLAGQAATFTAIALAGTPAAGVQWQVSTDGGNTWANAVGTTSITINSTGNLTFFTAKLTLSAAKAAMDGNMYRAVFSNNVGSSTSLAATLLVQALPAIGD